jgi:hypothetical protein
MIENFIFRCINLVYNCHCYWSKNIWCLVPITTQKTDLVVKCIPDHFDYFLIAISRLQWS